MSRAINLTLAEAVVQRKCQDAGIAISAIETLPSGGTHLVCVTGDGADLARKNFKNHVIEGHVKRFAFYHARHSSFDR